MSTYTPPGNGSVVRTVESKLCESVSAADYGAVGDGVVDDTIALTNTLAQSEPILLAGIFRITSPIIINNPKIAIHAAGASIKYDGAMGSAMVLQVNGANVLTVRGQLSIDCATKAGIGIDVRGIDGATLVDISGVTVTNCTHSSPSQSGAAGIQVSINSGNGKVARVSECVVSDVTRTTSNAACAGIVVTDFDVMIVHNNDVNNILTGTGNADADGIKVFSQLSGGATYSKCSASVRNNRVRNCEGRWVKTQVRGSCVVENNYFAIDTALALITSFRGVDAQVSDTTIQNNTVDLLSSWNGGAEAFMFLAQFNGTPDYLGQKIEHKILNNSVFSAPGVSAYSRVIGLDLTNMGSNAVTAIAHVDGNVAVGAAGWGGAAVGLLGITVRVPVAPFAGGATAHVVVSNNRFNTTHFMERLANGANASGGYDFADKLFLMVTGNYLPAIRGDIAVLPHDANNSYTSSFCVNNNAVGSRGNRVAFPFDFAKLLSGNNFYVGGESTPARTNSPANYQYGDISRSGCFLRTDNGAYRYASLTNIGDPPAWTRRGTCIALPWTVGTYSAARSVPNSNAATTEQLANALNTLVSDLKLAGLIV